MRFLVALCLLIVFSGDARALDGLVECPEGNEALPRVTHTPDGYPLTETFAIENGGRPLEVPIGHLSPWPSPRIYRMQPTPGLQGFDFSFWMPGGRMPEINTWLNVWNRACEAGRSQADAEHYIVNVKYIPLDTNTWYGRRRFDDDLVLSGMKEQFDFETQVQRTTQQPAASNNCRKGHPLLPLSQSVTESSLRAGQRHRVGCDDATNDGFEQLLHTADAAVAVHRVNSRVGHSRRVSEPAIGHPGLPSSPRMREWRGSLARPPVVRT